MRKPTTAKKSHNDEFAKIYYEHQYVRMAALEDQSFQFSNLVVVLTTATFAFVSTQIKPTSFGSWHLLLGVFLAINLVAILYILRVNDSISVHQRRAKKILELFAPEEFAVDKELRQGFSGRWQARPMLQLSIHLVLIVAGVFIFFSV